MISFITLILSGLMRILTFILRAFLFMIRMWVRLFTLLIRAFLSVLPITAVIFLILCALLAVRSLSGMELLPETIPFYPDYSEAAALYSLVTGFMVSVFIGLGFSLQSLLLALSLLLLVVPAAALYLAFYAISCNLRLLAACLLLDLIVYLLLMILKQCGPAVLIKSRYQHLSGRRSRH